MTSRPDPVAGDTLIGPFVVWHVRARRRGRPIGAVRRDGRIVGVCVRIGHCLVCVTPKSVFTAYRKRAAR